MQTDILLKQLNSSLAELKTAIDKFEKHPSPSAQYAELLHLAIQNSHKMVSAYVVLKEQKDISPELNLHLKLMNVPSPEEKKAIIEPIKEQVAPVNIIPEIKEEIKPVEIVKENVIEKVVEPVSENKPQTKEYPKVSININDKFRFINELFEGNATEYNIAVEQINAVSTLIELNNYLKGLMSIYEWKEDNEVVKNLYALSLKRFS